MILILLSLILSSILILIGRNYVKAAFILSIIFLSLVGLLFNPYIAQSNGVYTDLVRFFDELQLIKNYNLNDVLSSSVEPFKTLYPGLLVNNIIMFVVSKIGNIHLFPFLSVFSFYSILYIQLYKECQKYRLNKYKILLIFWLVYALINLTDPMDNIRNPFTSLFGVILLYNNLINGSSNIRTGVGYIIIFFIHSSAIIFPIINLVVKISNRWTKYIITSIVFIFSIFSYQFSSSLFSLIPGGSTLFNIINKLNAYSGGQADLVNYGTVFQKAMLWLTAVVAILVWRLFNKQTEEAIEKFSNACMFCIAIFLAGSAFSVHIFFRFGFILSIFILVMLPAVLRNNTDDMFSSDSGIAIVNSKISVSYLSLYILLGITILINLSWYFDTSAYRSINLGG